MVGMRETWRFVDEAPVMAGSQPGALTGLKQFALSLPAVRGQALVIVVSDLFEEAPIQPALTALRARGVDAAFLQVVAADDLEPPDGLLELNDAESSSKLPVGSDEVRAYREEVRRYLDRTRTAILRAGFKHVLLKVALPVEQAARQGNRPIPGTLTRDATDDVERSAFSSLVRASVLVKR